MLAAVDVQQHPRHGPPRPPPPVRPAPVPLRHQAGSLQRLLHPGVAQLDPVLLPQLLVEVPHVQVEVLSPDTAASTSSTVSSGTRCGLGFPLRRSASPV